MTDEGKDDAKEAILARTHLSGSQAYANKQCDPSVAQEPEINLINFCMGETSELHTPCKQTCHCEWLLVSSHCQQHIVITNYHLPPDQCQSWPLTKHTGTWCRHTLSLRPHVGVTKASIIIMKLLLNMLKILIMVLWFGITRRTCLNTYK